MIPPVIPATLLTNTTLPQPSPSIAGRHSWVSRYAAPQLMRHVRSKTSMETWSADLTPVRPSVEPALLMRIVGGPRIETMCSWSSRTCVER
jgi:hypothetical protein